MKQPLVTIIIPYYNKKDTIVRSIDSVIAQTYQNWELIIIDDCGDDKIEASKIIQDNRISVIYNETNLGAAKTRQRGLEIAKGEFIAFLDADDWWDLNFLEFCIEKLIDNCEIDGVYVQTKVINKDGSTNIRRYCELGLIKIRETLINYGKPWQTGGIVWNLNCCGDWGDLKTNEDSWFEIKSSKNNKLLPVFETFYFHDETGENHLSIYNGISQSTLDQQDLFIMIFSDFWRKIGFKYKVILAHRLLRGQLKIREYCSQSDIQIYNQKLANVSLILGMISKSNFLLKLAHKILQNSPFKIYY